MALTALQRRVCRLPAGGRRASGESYVAGGVALSVALSTHRLSEGIGVPAAGSPASARGSNLLWTQLMQRSFGFDVLACPACTGRLRLIALIDEPPVIRRILRHLGLPTELRTTRPCRAPPIPFALSHDDDPSVTTTSRGMMVPEGGWSADRLGLTQRRSVPV